MRYLLLLLAIPLLAERINVPLRDPSRAALVKMSTVNGSIQVKAHNAKDIVVELDDSGPRTRNAPNGMKEIFSGGVGVNIEEENNVVTISTGLSEHSIDLVVQVPLNTSLKLNAVDDGDILVENVEGEIEVNNVDGDVKLNKVSGTVVAHTVDGDLTISILKVNPGKAMSFSSLDGDIDVTFPADFKASVKVHSNNGEIYSDFDVQPATATHTPVVKDERAKGGKFSVQVDKGVAGNINGGGPEVVFKTFDGDIFIRKTAK